MDVTKETLKRQDEEISAVLKRARLERNLTIVECSAHIATSRKRYVAIEAARSSVSASELMLLVDYLGLALEDVFPALREEGIHEQRVVVRVRPGEIVQLRVELTGAED